jgi:hypothetical protein
LRTLRVAILLSFCAYAIVALATDMPPDSKPALTVFDVPIGSTVQAFTFSKSGELLYKAKPFVPPVLERKDTKSFHIQLVPSRNLAAATGKDIDGQNTLYLLKLNVAASIPFQRGWVKWVAPWNTYWSPSGKYLIALCAYEGERFLRAAIKSGEVVDGPFLTSPDKKRSWSVHGEPQWVGNTDVLALSVDERCDALNDGCGSDDPKVIDKVLGRHKVLLDAETLSLKVVQ